MLRRVLNVVRQVLGPEHPNTLITMSNLASSLHCQGKHAEAEQMQRELLDMRRRVLGAGHPESLATIDSLSNCIARKRRSSSAADPHPDVPPAKR